eukprot:TRINITY_DN48208_c0_g1_i1.p1 TRINITY_DN48208_c0_g1~~TRINITY_DN48208_c0_g1_i1.p1  ORF type:complete len:109 (+),score=12.94 TRINITY_DN48208_c0_g1_i1:68-394(+)
MQLDQTDKGWDTPLNKRMGSARGNRMASGRVHAVLIASVFGTYFWLTSHIHESESIKHLPPPPCAPPAPSREALSTTVTTVSYTHLRAHETPEHLVCRLLLEKKKKIT